jgi:hypothetical protein
MFQKPFCILKSIYYLETNIILKEYKNAVSEETVDFTVVINFFFKKISFNFVVLGFGAV